MTADADRTDLSIAGAGWLASEATQRVFSALTATGHEARAVGGCVRDTLLACLAAPNGAPADLRSVDTADIDIATTSEPSETMALAARAGLRAVPTGLAHGTVTVVAGGVGYEVTTLRHDVETYGRHADVAFTDDWALDAARRDFTINALYANPDGSLFDPLGGLPDLIARRVRFVGNPSERIREDYLRILRFFRFLARFGDAPPDPASLAACVAERVGLRQLSRERIGHEIIRLIVARRAAETVAIMAEYGILAEFLPVAPSPRRLTALAQIEAALATPADAALRLAALTVHVEEDAPRIAAALRLSKDAAGALTFWARTTLDFLSTGVDDVNLSAGAATGTGSADDAGMRRLLYRLGTENYRRRVLIEACCARLPSRDAEELSRVLTLPSRWTPPTLPITGHDLVGLGVPPGPAMGEVLRELEAAWEHSDFALVHDELTAMARQRITRPGT